MNLNPAPIASRMLSSRMEIFSTGIKPGHPATFTAVFSIPSLGVKLDVEFELGAAVVAQLRGQDDLIREGSEMVRSAMARVSQSMGGKDALPSDVVSLQASVRELVDALAESRRKFDTMFLHSVGASGE